MLRPAVPLLCFCLAHVIAPAQTPSKANAPSAPSQAAPAAKSELTVDDVVKMQQAGLSDELILAQIRVSKKRFTLSPSQLVSLREAGVSNDVLAAMQGLTPAQAGTNGTSLPKEGTAAPINAANTPSKPGIYVEADGQWTPLSAESIKWQHSGLLQHLRTGNVDKGVVGLLEGPHAKQEVSLPARLLIVSKNTPIDPEHYLVVRLRRNALNRELRITSGSLLHHADQPREAVPVQAIKLSADKYLMTIAASTMNTPGEFGLVPSREEATNGEGGSIYPFRVIP